MRFKIINNNFKISYLCNEKDAIPLGQKNNVIYEIKCPACAKTYIGKTNCCVEKRMTEHALKADQPFNIHLQNCDNFNYFVSTMNLPDINLKNKNKNKIIKPSEHMLEAILPNYKILNIVKNSFFLKLYETYYIKKLKPEINDGLKNCIEFKVFDF